jgi:hypothetical protein
VLTSPGSAYKFITKACYVRRETRDRVLTLDFRPLVLLLSDPSRYQDWLRVEDMLSCEFIFRHVTMFKNVRFVSTDGLKYSEDDVRYDYNALELIEDTKVSIFSSAYVPQLDGAALFSPPGHDWLSNVMYLDLSYTLKTEQLASALNSANLQNLRVLKLRGLRLTDRELPYSIIGAAQRLWSLDISNNLLTDGCVDTLFELSAIGSRITPSLNRFDSSTDAQLYEDTPLYQRDGDTYHPPTRNSAPMRPDSKNALVEYLDTRAHYFNNAHRSLDPNDPIIQTTGLTHLVISHNKLSTLGILHLMREGNRLQLLDVGAGLVPRISPSPFGPCNAYCAFLTTRCLERSTGTCLENLRIHHSLVTQIPTVVRGSLSAGWNYISLWEAEKITPFLPPDISYHLFNPAFKPEMNYRLKNLTLTSIPTKSYGPTIHALSLFIRRLSDQESILTEARNAQPFSSSRTAPKLLPGLRSLRLEFLVEEKVNLNEKGKGTWDRDADKFYQESERDFSFFGDNTPVVHLRRRESGMGGRRESLGEGVVFGPNLPVAMDVMEELKRFRRGYTPRWSGKLELVVPRG